jgi:ankyrin repeat protein
MSLKRCRAPISIAKRVQFLMESLKEHPEWATIRTQESKYPLHYAVVNDQCEGLLKQLLALGADVDCVDVINERPIHTAIQLPSGMRACQCLVEHAGERILWQLDRMGNTALILAVSLAQSAMVGYFLAVMKHSDRYNAYVNAQDDNGNTALHHLVLTSMPNMEIMQQLFAAGANPLQLNKRGISPFNLALRRSPTSPHASQLVDTMLRLVGPINQPDSHGYFPLHWAIVCRHKKAVQTLLEEYHIDPNLHVQNVTGFTSLILAIQSYGKDPAIQATSAIIDLLLERGADPTVCDASGKTASEWALDLWNKTLIQKLQRHVIRQSAAVSHTPRVAPSDK